MWECQDLPAGHVKLDGYGQFFLPPSSAITCIAFSTEKWFLLLYSLPFLLLNTTQTPGREAAATGEVSLS